MASRTSLPRRVQALAVTVAAALIALLGAVVAPSTAVASPLYCGSSKYVHYITVEHFADGNFKIEVIPNAADRTAPDPHEATVEIWHAVQACVPGLYDGLADSIWDQLECHQYLALLPSLGVRVLREGRELSAVIIADGWATGDSYDLESWTPAFSPGDVTPATYLTWYDTHCGNTLGGPASSPSLGTWPPDEGQTDLRAPDYVA